MASKGDERASVAAVEPQEELGGPQTKLRELCRGISRKGHPGTWEGLQGAEHPKRMPTRPARASLSHGTAMRTRYGEDGSSEREILQIVGLDCDFSY